jgi:hypothetical protein
MALQPWVTNAFNPLDMFGIQGYPHAMPDKFDKWFPKFPGNNVIIVEEHIDTFYACFQNHLLNNDDEDVVMKLFAVSLVENARKWYNNLPDKSIKTWQAFHDTFMKRWGITIRKEGRILLAQFNEMKKENKSIKKFDTIFENLLKQIPNDIIPKDGAVLQYTNAFEGKFGFMLRDKSSRPL